MCHPWMGFQEQQQNLEEVDNFLRRIAAFGGCLWVESGRIFDI